jgi:glucose/arabinose dehydrogenase
MTSLAVAAGAAALVLSLTAGAAGPVCDPDNGGLKLPQGFCAVVVAENVGPARHLTVAPNGVLYVSTRNAGRGATGGVVALKDTNGDGKMDSREHFGSDGATGVALRNGYVYMATTNSIVRYKLGAGELAPDAPAEVIVEGLTDRRQHADKGIAFDGRGGVYVNIGAPSNACQVPDRQPKVAGQDPLKVQGATAKKLARLIKGATPAKLRKRPAPEKWSAAEILAHLADAEIGGVEEFIDLPPAKFSVWESENGPEGIHLCQFFPLLLKLHEQHGLVLRLISKKVFLDGRLRRED